MKPAIVAVGYNRPDGMKRLLESIGRAQYRSSGIPLIVSIDESNRSDEVEKVAKEFQWNYGPKVIRRFPERQGLRKHIVKCGDYSETYGAVIILEDDLIVSEDFYNYTCAAHEMYQEDSRICGVSLYGYHVNVFNHFEFRPVPSIYDVYLGDMVVTWGQSWTKAQWTNFKAWYLEHEDKLPKSNPKLPKVVSGWTRSWGRYFASYIVENDLSYIYPYQSRTTCFSDYGEHYKGAAPLTYVQVPLMHGCPMDYRFGKFEDLIRYDSFYERVLDERYTVCGISGKDICMDTANMKTSTCGKAYVVSNEKLPYEKVASFGLTLRPICLNVLEEQPGNELHLYRLESDFIRKWDDDALYYADHRRLRYEYFDKSWRKALKYVTGELTSRIRKKF